MGVTASGTSGVRFEMPDSALADTVLERLTATYAAAADPRRAASMQAYMKDIAPFLGLTTPERRALSRVVVDGTPRPGEADCTALALRCWQLPEREYQYFAVDYLRRHVKRLSSGFLPVARHLVSTVSWWDTVDLLACHVVGGLVTADPALKADMDAWIEDDDLWVARTALLHQLRYKDATDTERLFAYGRSAGVCASTPRRIRTRYAASSRSSGDASRRCRCVRRSRTSDPDASHADP